MSVAFTAVQRRRKDNIMKLKKATLKQSLHHTLPEVFVKSILQRSSTPDVRNGVVSRTSTIYSGKVSDDKEHVCSKCQQQMNNEHDESSQYGAPLDGLSDDTVLVAHQLKHLKEQRRRFQEQQKLDEVLERVHAALKHSGIEFNDQVIKIPTQNDLDMFSIEGSRQKKKERSHIAEMFSESEKLSVNRDEVMQEVENWFFYSNDDLTNFCSIANDEQGPDVLSDDYFIRIHKAFRRSNDSINKLVGLIQRTVAAKTKNSRVKGDKSKLAEQVLELDHDHSDKLDPEYKSSQDSVSEHKIRINKKICTDNELNSLKNMQHALKNITTLLSDGIRHGSSSQAKSCYKLGLKQFKIMTSVIERKYEHNIEQDEKLKVINTEVTNLKFVQQQRQNDTIQIRKLNEENHQLRDEITYLQQCIQEMDKNEDINEAQYENSQRSTSRNTTSRHVSIKLPEQVADNSSDASPILTTDITVVSQNDTASPDIDITNDTESQPSVTSMRDNLLKKLSDRKTVVSNTHMATINASTLQAKESSRKTLSTQNVTAKASSIPSATVTRISRLELDEYDSESVSSHEQFESIVKKSEHHQNQNQPTEQFRQQIHMLREELRNSDDRYYEQREELERLKQIVACQSTSKPESKTVNKEPKYEKQIEKLQLQQKLMKKEITVKIEELGAKKKLIDQLRHQLEVLINERDKSMNESEDATTLQEPAQIIELPRLDLSDMPRDQLIAKISRESDKEIHRLRNFIVKEQQRFQASLRRNNLDANKTVAKLRKENIVVIRAIAHFKETANKLLQQEVDDDESQMEDSLSVLSADQHYASLSDGAVETLVALERRLNAMLVQKRLVVKHTNASKVTAAKELEQCRVHLKRRTEEYADQQQSIKKAGVRNETLVKQCQQLNYENQCLQKEMVPCKELVKKYNSIQEEVDQLKVSEKETSKDNKLLTKGLELDRNRLKKELNQLAIAQICRKSTPNNTWNRMNCGQRKQLIDKAFLMSQISPLHHEAGKNIVSYCNELAIEQFAHLVKRYMDLRKFQRIKHSLTLVASRYNEDKRFSKHILRTQERFALKKSVWDERTKEIQKEREKSFMLLRQVFDQNEDGQGFIVPTIQLSQPTYPTPPKGVLDKPTKVDKREKLGQIIGYNICEGGITKQSLWQMPPTLPDNLVHVTTPRMLAMDINKIRQPTSSVPIRKHSKTYLPAIATLFP